MAVIKVHLQLLGQNQAAYRTKIMIKILSIIIFATFLVTNEMRAQTRQEEPTVSVSLVSTPALPSKAYILTTGEERHVVEISSWKISSEIEVLANTLCTIRQEGTENEDGPLIARFTPKAEKKHQLAVLIDPNGETSKENQVIILNIGADSFLGGERYAINLSSFPVAIQLENIKTSLPSMKVSKILKPNGKNGDFQRVVGMFNHDGKWKPFMTSRWILDGESRALIFIFNNVQTKSLTWNGMNVPFPASEKKK